MKTTYTKASIFMSIIFILISSLLLNQCDPIMAKDYTKEYDLLTEDPPTIKLVEETLDGKITVIDLYIDVGLCEQMAYKSNEQTTSEYLYSCNQ